MSREYCLELIGTVSQQLTVWKGTKNEADIVLVATVVVTGAYFRVHTIPARNGTGHVCY